MTKLNKRAIDNLLPLSDRDVFVWDSEVRGFGLRLKPSGVKTYLIQYRNADGRTRRMVIGKHGILTTEQARDLARQQLAEVLNGEDPSAKRRAARSGMTVSHICDWYLTEARAGRLLGRNRRPIKASTLDGDEGRINVHIKPLIGAQLRPNEGSCWGCEPDCQHASQHARSRQAVRLDRDQSGAGCPRHRWQQEATPAEP